MGWRSGVGPLYWYYGKVVLIFKGTGGCHERVENSLWVRDELLSQV